MDFNNVTNDYLVDNYNGEIDFNNKKLINLKRTIFNKLGINAVVKNMMISGSTSIIKDGDVFQQEIHMPIMILH